MLSLLKQDGNITVDRIIELLDIPRRTVSRILRKLKEKGLIERVGSDKSGYWKVIEAVE